MLAVDYAKLNWGWFGAE